MEEHIAFPHNLTYIHVHKYEGSTSIQSALSKRSTLVKNIQFRVSFDDQLEESVIETHTDVHQYKHSYGGGAMRKKEWWDIERHDHIHSISNLHRTLQLMRYSMITKLHFQSLLCYENPIERFLSAIQSCITMSSFVPNAWMNHPIQSTKRQLQYLVKSAIDDMRETNYRRDVHLLPMTAHFRLLDGASADESYHDIPISIFNMNELQDVLYNIRTLQPSSIGYSCQRSIRWGVCNISYTSKAICWGLHWGNDTTAVYSVPC